MSVEPRNLTGAPGPREDLVRETYDITHPRDTFDDLHRRARFDKYDKGLLRDWMAVAAELEQQKLRWRISPFRFWPNWTACDWSGSKHLPGRVDGPH